MFVCVSVCVCVCVCAGSGPKCKSALDWIGLGDCCSSKKKTLASSEHFSGTSCSLVIMQSQLSLAF